MPNVNFKITMDETEATRFSTALCISHAYNPVLINPITEEAEANPETAQDFAFRMMIKYIKEITKYYETKGLSDADKLLKIAEIDAMNITMEII